MVSTFSNIFLLFGEAFLFMLWEMFMQRGTRTVKLSRRICEKFLTNSTGSGKRKIKYCMAVVIKYLQLKSLFLWGFELEFWMVWYFTRHKIIVSYYTVNCACLFYFPCFFRVFFFSNCNCTLANVQTDSYDSFCQLLSFKIFEQNIKNKKTYGIDHILKDFVIKHF